MAVVATAVSMHENSTLKAFGNGFRTVLTVAQHETRDSSLLLVAGWAAVLAVTQVGCSVGNVDKAGLAGRCAPTTCAAEGAECGTIPDGCGGVLTCGNGCPPGRAPDGGAVQNGGRSCAPTTCAAQGLNCGSASDGCNGTLNCGTCSGNATCGGGGVANVCGASAGTGRFVVTPWAIYDPQGVEWNGKSESVSAYGMWWDGQVIGDENALINCWKSTALDACGSVVNPSSGLSNDTWDAIIAHYTPLKIVVIVTTVDNPAQHWSDSTFSSPTGAYQTWLKAFAAKYADNPYVWYDVVGENGVFGDCIEANYVTVSQALIKTIRDAGANNVIAVLGNASGQDAGSLSGPVVTSTSCHLSFGSQLRSFGGKDYTGDGILYAIHPYEIWNTDAYNRLDNYIDRNQARGQYVRLDDQADANGSYAACDNTLVGVYQAARERRLTLGGPWYWTGDDSAGSDRDHLVPSASGSAINSCTSPTNLTTMGTAIWNENHFDYKTVPTHIRNPSPAHSATGVSRNVTLSWTAALNATSYDVYFGTTETPGASELKGNQSGTSFNPGSLAANTTYYWRVSPKNGNGTVKGGVMTFTTGM